ncbi:chemotaxis response regulator protein-glutamate methylesterase [Methylothermus subterraneus]
MPVRALVVDDSAFMRQRIAEILEEGRDIEVVDVARDGAEAVRKAVLLRPEVITMDVEMPGMDGIQAVREIMRRCPTPILMLSALTRAGAQATLAALEAGAMDFIPKRLEDIGGDREAAKRELRRRVRLLAAQARRISALPKPERNLRQTAPQDFRAQSPQLVVIAASTGGPLALQQILTRLSPAVDFAILLVQHMPGHFTPSFAARLNQLAKIEVREAVDGDVLRPGVALLAPGGKQMEVRPDGRIAVRAARAEEIYRPSADVTFASVAEHVRGPVLGIVLTGMGADGKLGAERLKRTGNARIWVQDEASCVVYGMPKAVAEAGLADRILPLGDIAAWLEAI